MSNHLKNYFDYGSILPLIIFILGIYSIFLFIKNNFSFGFLIILLNFTIYVINNIITNYRKKNSIFNEYLEDSASFIAFSITTIVFGIVFFKENPLLIIVLLFYSTSQILSLSRNWTLKIKNSCGWPLPLNGIFFPFFYYLYIFYLKGFGEAIFFIYYVIIGLMTLSNKNFLGYDEVNEEKLEINLKKGEKIKI